LTWLKLPHMWGNFSHKGGNLSHSAYIEDKSFSTCLNVLVVFYSIYYTPLSIHILRLAQIQWTHGIIIVWKLLTKFYKPKQQLYVPMTLVVLIHLLQFTLEKLFYLLYKNSMFLEDLHSYYCYYSILYVNLRQMHAGARPGDQKVHQVYPVHMLRIPDWTHTHTNFFIKYSHYYHTCQYR